MAAKQYNIMWPNKFIGNIYLQKLFSKIRVLIYYIQNIIHTERENEKSQQPAIDKQICLFFLQKTLVTQANHSISKSLQKEKTRYSTERLIVGKLLLLVPCPVNVFVKEQKYYYANHHYTTLDSNSFHF